MLAVGVGPVELMTPGGDDVIEALREFMLGESECLAQAAFEIVARDGTPDVAPDGQTETGMLQVVRSREDRDRSAALADAGAEHRLEVAIPGQAMAPAKKKPPLLHDLILSGPAQLSVSACW